ncbi:LOW QUALITY PROTEIN: probable L-gulonolactone oxidase 6 [Benincasa hispida]|uniref:LOW QUALITY PROTEIN: probable L-gulonolactone oxidase 6 n=1 Tax=Benincasa hispida TaxID=102211 RepID=UPI001900422F|nr:LOW QUALITY PROTEIN: probable L-gulonolactone oxidase 6 [Benincasa hispida]
MRRCWWWSYNVALVFLLVVILSDCSPPEDPIKCGSVSPNKHANCTITNAYAAFPDRTICRAAEVIYPTTEAEVMLAVAAATRGMRKMKVGTRFSHSIPKLSCPEGEDGVVISTKYLNRTLMVDVEGMSISVEGGATVRQIIEEVAAAGLALPHTPYWWGLTIGGLLSTGAHGSSLWGKGSAVHDYVVAIQMVTPGGPQDGYAKLRTLLPADQYHLNAAKVSLGVLGVITQVTLKLEPMFKRSITYLKRDDKDLGDEVVSFGRSYEFGDMIWYPSQRKVVYRIDSRVPSNTSGNGFYDFIPFRPTPSLALALVRASEEKQESRRDAVGKCISANLFTSTLSQLAYGLTNNGISFLKYPVIGDSNRLQSSGSCLHSLDDFRITACPWDPLIKGEFFHQTAISIDLGVVKSFVQDVQKLAELEPMAFCGLELYNGILMRYVTASTAYLGKQQHGVDFDFTYYRSRDPMSPRLFEDVFEEVEQMAVFKYGGIPHWGKNRNVAFHQAFRKYRNRDSFVKIMKEFDPHGLFSNEWTDQILGLKGTVNIYKDGCALEGLCICSQHTHCAPTEGYFCTPGRIYKEARVCSYLGSSYRP